MKLIKTTYSQITPESASNGDFSETGWIDEKGESFDSVEEAVDWLKREGAIEPSSTCFHPGIWYSTGFVCVDYSDGTEEERAFHLKGFTPEEEREVYELLHA